MEGARELESAAEREHEDEEGRCGETMPLAFPGLSMHIACEEKEEEALVAEWEEGRAWSDRVEPDRQTAWV